MENAKTTLQTVWNGDSKGKGSIKTNHLDTNIAIPESLGGNGEGAEPKEILISSATACFTMTLTGVLQGRKLPVDKITIDTESTTTKEDGFQITHYPHLFLPVDATEDQVQTAERAIELADKACKIGNLLRKAGVQIHVEGKVSTSDGAED